MNEININVSKLLDGQNVLVTGAGQGNGRAIAKGIARSGAHVVVTDVQLELAESTVQQIRSDGGEASAFHLDVTDPKECVSVAERIRSEIGQVNVVVNNAGIIIARILTVRRRTITGDASWTSTSMVSSTSFTPVFRIYAGRAAQSLT